MSKVMDGLRSARDFLAEVRNELRKSSWPTRNELLESTVVLIVGVILFSVFVGVSDAVLIGVLKLLVR